VQPSPTTSVFSQLLVHRDRSSRVHSYHLRHISCLPGSQTSWPWFHLIQPLPVCHSFYQLVEVGHRLSEMLSVAITCRTVPFVDPTCVEAVVAQAHRVCRSCPPLATAPDYLSVSQFTVIVHPSVHSYHLRHISCLSASRDTVAVVLLNSASAGRPIAYPRCHPSPSLAVRRSYLCGRLRGTTKPAK